MYGTDIIINWRNNMNLVMFQGFQWYLPDDGNYYKNMKDKIPELKEAGIDAIWLPPFCKATGTNAVSYTHLDVYKRQHNNLSLLCSILQK